MLCSNSTAPQRFPHESIDACRQELTRLREENAQLQNQVTALDLELSEEWEFGNPEMRYTEFVRLREENERLRKAIEASLQAHRESCDVVPGRMVDPLRDALAKEEKDGA